MKVSVDFYIDAGHRLMHHTGKCRNLHGHQYVITVGVDSYVDYNTGMVIDFTSLKEVAKPIIDKFDHAMILNKDDIINIDHCRNMGYRLVVLDNDPTAEIIAMSILKDMKEEFNMRYSHLSNCLFVSVSETHRSKVST